MLEKPPECHVIPWLEHGKSGKRLSFAAIESWRHPPRATASDPQFFQLPGRVFDQPIRRVGYDRVDAVMSGFFQPIEGVGVENLILPCRLK